MPDIAAPFRFVPGSCLIGTFNLPQQAFRRRYLVGTHDKKGIAHIEHRIGEEDVEQGVFLKEGRRKVFQIFDQFIVCLGPVHGEIEAVLIAFGGVGKVAAVGAVGNDEDLQVLEEGVVGIQALFAVAVYLVEGLPKGNAPFLQFHLHQGEAVDKNGDIVAVGMGAFLFKL